jgi:hypothetical protein
MVMMSRSPGVVEAIARHEVKRTQLSANGRDEPGQGAKDICMHVSEQSRRRRGQTCGSPDTLSASGAFRVRKMHACMESPCGCTMLANSQGRLRDG